ncbi:hypothetical protein F5878DRAFT_635641 [Lentinula raphanica]|uniref:Uncharacterized protein n=1 Tax=Lentinula raphanica TaxID=153919 RepID=A0AA38U472_9AGAR|nr:hypothetical protein F5880DRAFT_1591673 [Lentinula raphanica]KAJ3832049.1 hypothetical protein F5878DRAFT_635641 [Lentinula raphanica]
MAATTGIGLAAQVLSATCDLDDRLNLNLANLLPKTQQRRMAITAESIDISTKILESVRDLVMKHGTIDHKNEFHELSGRCRSNISKLEELERSIKEKQQSSSWKILYYWKSLDDEIRTEFNKLETEVARNKHRVFRASMMFRAQLVDFGLVTIVVEEPQQQVQQGPLSLDDAVIELPINTNNNPISNPESTRSWQNQIEIIEMTVLNSIMAGESTASSVASGILFPDSQLEHHQYADPLGAVLLLGSGKVESSEIDNTVERAEK